MTKIDEKINNVTEKAKIIICDIGRASFAKKLGISRTTLNKRLLNKKWTLIESLIIENLSL